MRQRHTHLRTGQLLLHNCKDTSGRPSQAGVLFLVESVANIDTLTNIHKACKEILLLPHWEWKSVANRLDMASIAPYLSHDLLTDLEVQEFAAPPDDISKLLAPIISQLEKNQRVSFPSAMAVGGIAQGTEFIGRQKDIAALQNKILQGTNILLTAPRRSGKTSLLRRLEQLMDSHDIYFWNMEADSSLEGATARFLSLTQKGLFTFGQASKQVREKGWESILKDTWDKLELISAKPILLFLDELVGLLENLKDQQTSQKKVKKKKHKEIILLFLKRLGENIIKNKSKLIVAGSADLYQYLVNTVEVDSSELPPPFNHLEKYTLGPLLDSDLHLELRRILMGCGVVPDQDDLNWLKDNLDLSLPHPALSFISEFTSTIKSGQQIGPVELEKRLTEFLDSTSAFKELANHLKDLNYPIAELTRLFKKLSTSLTPIPITELSNILSEDLEKQNWFLDNFPVFIEHNTMTMKHVAPLFQRWWQRQYGED